MTGQQSLLDNLVAPAILHRPGERLPLIPALPVTPYPGGAPRVAGSDTSTAAAKSVEKHVGPMQAEILRLLTDRPDNGLTCDELEAITGWAHQSASARVRELVLAGLVVDTGCRRVGRSGRSARVYQRTR